MAGIDKTYVNREQLKEVVTWARLVGEVTLENGYKFFPLDFIRGYNDIDNPEFWKEKESDYYVLWNTPFWFDRWVWVNCPLGFVRERLRDVYDKETLKSYEHFKFCDPRSNRSFGKQKYTYLKVPSGKGYKWLMNNGRRKNPWPRKIKQLTYMIEIKSPNNWREDLAYDKQTNMWYKTMWMLPAYDNYVWQEYHRNIPSKKSIIRTLRKWYIPSGYTVRVYNLKYIGMDFEILVK